MRLKRLLLFPLLLCAWADGFAQEDYTHVELQGGYELFPGMSNKSGVCLNLGGRYAFNERFFAAAMIHSGINNGSYMGTYAGERTKLKHNMREYMIGAGPGVSVYNGGEKWIYADVLLGYGFGEERRASEESSTKSLDGFAAAAHIGAEGQTEGGWVLGASLGGYFVGGEIRPALSLKCGLLLNLF